MRRILLILAPLILSLLAAGEGRADMLSLLPRPVVQTLGTTTIRVEFKTTQVLNVQAFDLAIAWDDTMFEIGNVRLSAATLSAFAVTANTGIAGKLVASASANSSGINLANGATVDLLLFDLTARSSTSMSEINLLANLSTTFTSVNENLPLSPAPTNGFDRDIDTIIGVPVPEPGSGVLVALGVLCGLVGKFIYVRK